MEVHGWAPRKPTWVPGNPSNQKHKEAFRKTKSIPFVKLWERPKLLISMIWGFLNPSPSPKTNIMHLWRTPEHLQKNQENSLELKKTILFPLSNPSLPPPPLLAFYFPLSFLKPWKPWVGASLMSWRFGNPLEHCQSIIAVLLQL